MMQAMITGKSPRPSISETLDFALVKASFGQAGCRVKPHPLCLNPMDGLHRGWYCTSLDSALGYAVHTTMPAGRAYTTPELKANFVQATTPNERLVHAIGKAIHGGNQVATAEASIVGHDGKLYPHATTTRLVFDVRG
jgi:uncharacterized protein (TIGR00369 family)